MEKTYFEFKITFLHIVVFLVAVIAIGIFLFYMGYQAGQRRTDPRTVIANQQNQAEAAGAEELSVVDEKPVRTMAGKAAAQEKKGAPQSIPEEMKLHEEQEALKAPAEGAKEPPPAEVKKPVAPGPSYTIQVGAFADFANAQKCSRKFTSLGYPTAIITDNQKKLHTVQVGSFSSLAAAQKEMARLESQEKAKFQIKPAR
jgi:cell division septation protein DedD